MNKFIKIAIALVLLAGSIYFFSEREYGWGTVLAVLTTIPIILFFRNEFILLSFFQLRKENLAGARKWLNKITNPQAQLHKKQMGYYYYLMGITEGQNNLNASEKYMKKALEYGLSFKHDRAMANLNLAGVAMSRGKKKEAERYLKVAKEMDTQGMMTEQIKMMQQQVKRVNVGRNMQNPNMRRRGKYF